MGKHAAHRKHANIFDLNVYAQKLSSPLLVLVSVILLIIFGIYACPKKAAVDQGGKAAQEQSAMSRDEAIEAYNKGDYDTAIPKLKSLVESDGNDLEAREMLATSYFLLAKNKLAIEEYKAIGKQKPNDAETDYKIGLLLRAEGRIVESISYLKRAAQTAPGVVLFHAELARAYAKSENYPASLEEWKIALNLLPAGDKVKASILIEIANIYITQNDFNQANTALESGLNIDPDNETIKSLKAKMPTETENSSTRRGR